MGIRQLSTAERSQGNLLEGSYSVKSSAAASPVEGRPKNQTQKMYKFDPTPHGGGYDDIAFRGDDVFLSASNPSNNPNTGPAIVKAQIRGSTVVVTPVLSWYRDRDRYADKHPYSSEPAGSRLDDLQCVRRPDSGQLGRRRINRRAPPWF